MDVPEGSIWSKTYFVCEINSITQCLNPGVDCSLFTDLLQIVQHEYYRMSGAVFFEYTSAMGNRQWF